MSSTPSAADSSRAWLGPAATLPALARSNIASAANGSNCLRSLQPDVKQAAVLRDPSLAAGIGQFAAIQALAPQSLGVELTPIDVQDPSEIERAITAFAHEPNGGLIATASAPAVKHRNLIIALALKHRIPNVYGYRYYPANGGLASYGPNVIDEHKRAAAYVDRILRGAKPADLPVQTPTNYELVVNLKTGTSRPSGTSPVGSDDTPDVAEFVQVTSVAPLSIALAAEDATVTVPW